MRILIVKTSALGDVVHALPVLDFLHRLLPGVEVDWLVEEGNRAVLADNPLIAQLLLVRIKKWRRHPFSGETWREMAALRRQLRQNSYDLVIDIQGNTKSGLLTLLSGAKRRVGFGRDGVREWPNLLCTTEKVPLRPEDYQISDRSLRVASVAIGSDYQGMAIVSDIVTSLDEDLRAGEVIAAADGRPRILFHPGTTWKTKLWYEGGWIELGQRLMERYPEAVIFLSAGTDEERQLAERIVTTIGRRATVVPPLSLKEFIAFLKRVDIVLGGDTGPIHLAAAVSTPTVSFYRVTDGRRNAPRGERHRLVQSPLVCSRCLRKECKDDAACRQSITAAALEEQVVELLGPMVGD
ncbi:MAG TPA: lipopolysaccharide heptosyltransferase I [Geobacterales bacterium]|nr:lipopolysaccharide heptosyltransferase I [Geobacterales bacterium]